MNAYTVGAQPGMGRYRCTSCQTEVTIDRPGRRLPPCPTCGPGHHSVYDAAPRAMPHEPTR